MILKKNKIALCALLLCFHGIGNAQKNTPPTVTLTSPAAQTFAPPATVSLSANASDANGTVTKVDFYRGTTLLFSDTTAPYAYTWTNVPAGTYSLTAKASDNGGAVTTSSTVTITVAVPKVAFSSPIPNGTYAQPYDVSGTFIGDPASTTVWVDNGETTRLATVDGNTFFARVPLLKGAHSARVSVVRSDRSSDNATINVNGWEAPHVVITEPKASTFNTPVNITFSAQAVSELGTIAKVSFFNGSTLLETVTAPPYQHTWLDVPKGNYNIRAEALDSAGFSRSADTFIQVLGQNAAPTVSIAAPLDNTSFQAPASIAIRADASDSDGTVSLVEFFQGDVALGASNVAPYIFHWSGVGTGVYSLRARATDNSGAQFFSNPVSVTVSPPNSTPAVALTAPAANAQFAFGAEIAMSATASDSDGSIQRVEFYADQRLVGTASTAPYTYSLKDATVGKHVLTARAFDNLGQSALSGEVEVSVAPPPPVQFLAPTDNTTIQLPGTVTLKVLASLETSTVAKIEILDGQTVLYTQLVPGAYAQASVEYAWADASAGTHVLVARVTDSNMLVSTSAPLTVRVLEPPKVTVDTGAKYYLGPAYIDLSATASAGANTQIERVEYYANDQLVAARQAPPYTASWGNVPAGSYILTAKAIDTLGASTVSAPKTVVVGTDVAITPAAGLDGSTTAERHIVVSGTIRAPLNSGVTVNGALASVTSAGEFFANGVVLQPGANSISIVVTSMEGVQASRTITVNSTANAEFVFGVSESTGFGQLEVGFTIDQFTSLPVTSVELRCNKDAPISASATVAEARRSRCMYEQAGEYRPQITVRNDSGIVFTGEQRVHVLAPEEVGVLVRNVYTTMIGRLTDKHVSLALRAFLDESRPHYQEIFTALGTDLPSVANQLGTIKKYQVSQELAQLSLVRPVGGTVEVFFVQMIYGDDGIWRISTL